MTIEKTPIEGLLILHPKVFRDERGYFFESYHQRYLQELGIGQSFVQDNQSMSCYGTIRGLHFQKGEWAQAKLVRVVCGAVYDVAVDLRPGSPTFAQWYGIKLSAENQKMFYIPRGFAHGFAALKDDTVFLYKCDNFYCPDADGGLYYHDSDIGIVWPIPVADRIISAKDAALPRLKALLQD